MAATAYLTGKLVLNVLIFPNEGAQAYIHHQGGMTAWRCLVTINDAAHVHLMIEGCDQGEQTPQGAWKAHAKSRSSATLNINQCWRSAVCLLSITQSSYWNPTSTARLVLVPRHCWTPKALSRLASSLGAGATEHQRI